MQNLKKKISMLKEKWKNYKETKKIKIDYFKYKVKLKIKGIRMNMTISNLMNLISKIRIKILVFLIKQKRKHRLHLDIKGYCYKLFMFGITDQIHNYRIKDSEGWFINSSRWYFYKGYEGSKRTEKCRKFFLTVYLLWSFLKDTESLHIGIGFCFADYWMLICPFYFAAKVWLFAEAIYTFNVGLKYGRFGLTLTQSKINKEDQYYVDFFVRIICLLLYLSFLLCLPSYFEFLSVFYTDDSLEKAYSQYVACIRPLSDFSNAILKHVDLF